MQIMYYIGLDIPKRTFSYALPCVVSAVEY
jgi:hypothetical protein